MTLVLDANVVARACLITGGGFGIFGAEPLIAPDLMWWEASSTLHHYLWHIEASRRTPTMAAMQREDVATALALLHAAPITREALTRDLLDEAWRVASRCGFARLYDAAYVAVALRHDATLVTVDRPLHDSPAGDSPAGKLVRIVGPADLEPPP